MYCLCVWSGLSLVTTVVACLSLAKVQQAIMAEAEQEEAQIYEYSSPLFAASQCLYMYAILRCEICTC